MHDAYGRELFLTRQQWRDGVLLGNIERVWNEPDELYSIIISALNDGFRSDVVKAAQHLYKIDPNQERGASVWGIVLMEEGRLDEAQAVFERHTARHGESGVILTNFAKVHAKRGDDRKAEEILWHALELDPNQDNGMSWYAAIHRERDGEEAGLEALRRVAQLPESWRAQLWLGRAALQRRELPSALALYRESLSRINPVPTDALMQISGDLGNAGHLIELLEITAPRFDPQVHGLQVGNNLIKAHLDLGQLDAARAILNQLYALNRPDWKPTLSFWDTELAKTRVATVPSVKQEDLKVAILTIDGPVWLKPTSPAAELFPARNAELTRIAFFGSSIESPTNPEHIGAQLADTKGRLARAIPHFLAEQVEFRTDARTQTLVPWIASGTGGFALAGKPWSDEQAADAARTDETKNDYVLVSHLKTGDNLWAAQIRLIRTIDGACVGSAETPISAEQPTDGVIALTDRLFALLKREAGLESQPAPPAYGVPQGADLAYYLLRLEQLLAVRCEAMQKEREGNTTLSGEREILDGNLHQCLAHPKSISVRVLMAQTFWTMRHARPDILPEFKERTEMLQREHPLTEPAHSVVQRILNEAFGK